MKSIAYVALGAALAGCSTSMPEIDCEYKSMPSAAKGECGYVDSDGYTCIFNGKDLTGWIGATGTYGVDPKEPGVLQCFPDRANGKEGSGGNLCTEREYSSYILKFEFMMPTNGNNGLGIHMTNINTQPAYDGLCELQLLDDGGSKYYDSAAKKDKLKPYQYTGSVYGVIPCKRDSDGKSLKKTAGGGSYEKPAGEWNFAEVWVSGAKVRFMLNGIVITDADLSGYKGDGKDTPDGRKHPGIVNRKGRIGWLGHGHNVKWRNIRIKEMPADFDFNGMCPTSKKVCPVGFTTLFGGEAADLAANWKGVTTKEKFDNPLVRKAATAEKRAEIQAFADAESAKHWHVRNGRLFFDGFKGGYSLATKKDYKDFEMLVDWRILSVKGDSGLYLRGSPQVQIWDAHNQWHIGSGGLYNNKKNPRNALVIADNIVGTWNTFRIRMVGEKVWVWLNDKLVVDNTTLENYWDRKQSILPIEQIELQCHGDPLEFRNIFIKEL